MYLVLISEKFNEREFMEHRCYLTITKNPLEDAFTTNILTTLISGRLVKRDIAAAYYYCCWN